MLLKRLEDGEDRRVEVRTIAREVCGAADSNTFIGSFVRKRLRQRRDDRCDDGPVIGREGFNEVGQLQRRLGQPLTQGGRGDAAAHVGDQLFSGSLHQFHDALLDPTTARDDHQKDAGRFQRYDFDVTDRRPRQ